MSFHIFWTTLLVGCFCLLVSNEPSLRFWNRTSNEPFLKLVNKKTKVLILKQGICFTRRMVRFWRTAQKRRPWFVSEEALNSLVRCYISLCFSSKQALLFFSFCVSFGAVLFWNTPDSSETNGVFQNPFFFLLKKDGVFQKGCRSEKNPGFSSTNHLLETRKQTNITTNIYNHEYI